MVAGRKARGRRGLAAAAGLATGLAAGAALAQTAPAAPASAPDAVSEVVVTGVRGGTRTVLDSPVPVDVLSGAQLSQAGVSGELAQALETLTPSFNFPRQSNSGVGDTVRAAQLRGLSPDQVLVLVNGRRYHTTSTPNLETKIGRGTAPVDFNTLPVEGVDRVEVLRDGAGAQYGSDAIAGVVDVQLDRRDHGGSIGVSYGSNITDPDAIGKTIADGATYVIDAKYGVKLGDGFLAFGGDYSHQQGTNRAGYDQGGQFLTNGSYTDPRNDAFFGQRLFKVGDPRVDSGHLWYNAETHVAPGLTFYSFGIAHDREAVGANYFRWPVIVDGNGDDYLPPNEPGGLSGFRPQSVIRNRDVSFTAGLKGEYAGWKLDGSATYGRNWITSRLKDTVNYSLGADSPQSFLLARVESDQLTLNLDATRELDLHLASPITLAVGAEYRRETWGSHAGDPASYEAGPLSGSLGLQAGSQGDPGLTPDDVRSLDRHVGAVYAEASGEVLPTLFADLAARVEDYSDAGSNLAGKLALRWEFTPGYALRGSVSNSFRAPGLAQEGAASTALDFGVGGALQRISTLPVDSPVARALGAKALDPEESVNVSLGLTAQPIRGLRLSVDGFNIRVNHRITLSEQFDLSGLSDAQRSALGVAGFDGADFFTNAVDLETRGVEAVAAYSTRVWGGALTAGVAYSYADNTIRKIAAPPPQLAANGITGGLVGVEERNTLTSAAPKDKLILDGGWSRGPFALTTRLTRFGEVTRVFDFGGGFVPTQTFGAEWKWDAQVDWKVTQRVTLSVGAENLLDAYPDRSIDDINGAGNLAYDVLSPIGINGRSVYARARLAL